MLAFLYIICLIQVLILRDEMYSIAPAAKARQIAIIVVDILPKITPKKAPIPVVIPDIIVYANAFLGFIPPDFIGTLIYIPSGISCNKIAIAKVIPNLVDA